MGARRCQHHHTSPDELDRYRQPSFALDDQVKSGKRQTECVHIDGPAFMRIRRFVFRQIMTVRVTVLGYMMLADMSMDEGCRVPMIVLIMGMEQWRGEQGAQDCHNADKRIKPSHALTILLHLERLCQRNSEFGDVDEFP